MRERKKEKKRRKKKEEDLWQCTPLHTDTVYITHNRIGTVITVTISRPGKEVRLQRRHKD